MANPEDKEMKKQWITVDGRQTPIILPQIWDHDKEEWIVTGTNNPLPTQVTGSIVEKFSHESAVTLSPSESFDAFENEERLHKNILIFITLNSGSDSDIRFQFKSRINPSRDFVYRYYPTLDSDDVVKDIDKNYSLYVPLYKISKYYDFAVRNLSNDKDVIIKNVVVLELIE